MEAWVCPKCGRVYGPMVQHCEHCNAIILREEEILKPRTVIPNGICNDPTIPIDKW